jgi:hypothetical protein
MDAWLYNPYAVRALELEQLRRVRARAKKRSEENQRAALHESGHAVMAIIHNEDLYSVKLDCGAEKDNVVTYRACKNPMNEIFISLAGAAAECLAFGRSTLGGDDLRSAEFTAYDHMGGMSTAMWLVRKSEPRVQEMLVGHWRKVEELAIALLERRDASGVCVLDGAEARAIVGAF